MNQTNKLLCQRRTKRAGVWRLRGRHKSAQNSQTLFFDEMLTIKKQYLFIIIKKQIFKMKKNYIFRLARAILAASLVSTALGADFLFAYNENTNEVVVMKDDDLIGFDAAKKKADYLNEKLYPGWSYKKQEELEAINKKPFLMHRWYMVEGEVDKIQDIHNREWYKLDELDEKVKRIFPMQLNDYPKIPTAEFNPAPELGANAAKFFKKLRDNKAVYKFPEFWKGSSFYYNPLTNEGLAVREEFDSQLSETIKTREMREMREMEMREVREMSEMKKSMKDLGYEEVSMKSLIEGKKDPKKPLTVHWCVWKKGDSMSRYPLYKGIENSPQCLIDNYPKDYIQLSDKKPEKIEETEFWNPNENDWFYIKEDDPKVVVASSGSAGRDLNLNGFKKMSFPELLKSLQSEKKSVIVSHCLDQDKNRVPLWDKMKAGDTQCNIANYPKDFIELPKSRSTSFMKLEPDLFYKNHLNNTFVAVPVENQDNKVGNSFKREKHANGFTYQEFTAQDLKKYLSKNPSQTVTITHCVTMNESGQIDRQSLYQGMKPKDTPCNIEEYESNKQIALPKKN
jgi:hypothetical protein